MSKLKYIKLIFSNKYVLSIAAFLMWMSFFDANSFIVSNRNNNKIKELNKDIAFYQKNIEESLRQKNMLESDIEKFAREQYFMKKTDEEIFIVNNK